MNEKLEKLAGQVKEKTGKVTDDKSLELDGKLDQAEAELDEHLEKARHSH